MKILYSCLSKSWGGMEMVTLTGIKQLLKNNIKVELLCLNESRLQLEANNLGIIIHSIKVSNTLSPLSIFKTSSIIKSGNYDLIHSHASKDLWLIVPALKILKSKTPLVFTKHVGSYIIKKDFLHNKIYSRVNLAIAISTIIKNNLISTTSLSNDKIKIIFNGVDLIKFNPDKADKEKLKKEVGFAHSDIIIGMTGRFSPGKGHEEFLFAASELNKKHSGLKFVVVGEASRGEEEYAESIRRQAEDYGLKNMYFLGFRTDIPDVLASLDVFVFPSHAEAFGIALIEAMAMEKPSVCSDSDGVLDIAVNDETGYLFKVKDGKDLSIKLEEIILDSSKRITFGKNARNRVEDFFEIDKITNQTIKYYLELTEEKK